MDKDGIPKAARVGSSNREAKPCLRAQVSDPGRAAPSPRKQRDVPTPGGRGQSSNSQQAGGGAAPWGECGGERVILTSTGISSSDIELAGLSLVEGAATMLLAKP